MGMLKDSGRRAAFAAVAAGIALSFASSLEPMVTGAHRLDVPALSAGLSPYLLLGILAGVGRGRRLALGAAAVLGLHLVGVLAAASVPLALYWAPLVGALIPAVLLPAALADADRSITETEKPR